MNEIDNKNVHFVEIAENFQRLCLIDFSNREISLNKIFEGQELLLNEIAKFSEQKKAVCLLFTRVSLYDLPSKMGVFVLDNGTFLGLYEEGKVLEHNTIDVFETCAGRLGILIFEDIYLHNVFYYLETLAVDFVVVLCGEEEVEIISKLNTSLPCIFLVENKILFDKI